MKLLTRTLIVLAAILSLSSVQARAQVTVSVRNMALKDALLEVEKQSGYGFFYSNALTDANTPVSVEANDRSIEYVMDQLLKGLDVTYEITKDKLIAITSREKNEAKPQTAISTDVKGRVTDQGGEPVVGAVVMVKGRAGASGTMTDVDGSYSIAAQKGAELEFSCLGFETQTITVGNDRVIDVVLSEDAMLLEETVVVGYGVQKKVNLTGSVSAIDFQSAAEGRPVMSASAALAGMAAGMNVSQSSGQPGSESATIRIRGVGSFTSSASSPLVLVDGVEWSMDNVNPNDIATISVLKDAASTAIYGTRAANGVILVTTKTGSADRLQVSYSYKGIIQMPVNKLKWVSDYATYMDLFNEGCDNAGTSHKFSQTNIDIWRAAAADPYGLNEYGVPNYAAYPNTDWFNEIFQNGYSQEHNINISGGSAKVKYMISGGWLDNEGVMNRFNLDSSSQKANFRTNLEADVTKWLTMGTRILGQFQQYGCANISNGFNYLYMTTPGIYPGSENAWGRPANNDESPNANNIFGQMAGSTGTKRTWRVNGTIYAKVRPYKGVSIEGTFNYAPCFSENHTYSRENGYWDYITDNRYSSSDLSKAVVTDAMSRNYRMSTEILARYDTTIGKDHTLGALVGYSAMLYKSWGWNVQKKGATDWDLNDGSTYETLNSAGNTSPSGWGLRSYFGRVNYSYKDRYLFEANLRADGSSRFGTNTRFGVFPSFSAGWRINKEPWMSSTSAWLSNLKLRASWGQTGNNQGIGNYAWQATYATRKVTIDASNATALYIASSSNVNLKWETTETTDIGIDVGFFKDRLTADFDYYYKNTYDILFTPSTYLTMGTVSQVPSNLGSMWNQGVELQLNWKDSIGKDFHYNVGVNVSFNKNKVTSFKGELVKEWDGKKFNNNLSNVSENWASPGKLCEGHAIGEFYMLERYKGNGKGYRGGAVDIKAGPKDGMIRTEADMKWVKAMIESGYSFNGVTTVSPDQLWYGDFIYADHNGDKNYGNSDDMDFNGHTSTPKCNLGINIGCSWKGIDFNMSLAGAFGHYIYWATNYYNSTNVTWGYAIAQRIADDHYFFDPSNPEDGRTDLNATYPRLYEGDDRNRRTCDFFEYKGDYLKLKNVQLGYTLPSKYTKVIFIKSLRFYVSGENLVTLTKYPGMDPELGSTIGYPLMKQVSLGAQVTF